ncbi:hypothetical protein PAA8504_01793 [Palleronia abyssalis]|mgnify:CR=1 FL=1|uniref:Uncharacterized protein n=2 Tax=Palleronia abyssalis TaxID=1501240 RepID=A0A2R8BUZ3_9RHOB|nr:hypothetical protein PAA8504_01793 [Palleronia abyssalis]
MVIALTATMIALGMVLIFAILTTLNDEAPAVPETLDLPEGKTPAAVTLAEDLTVVVTKDGDILFFDLDGTLFRHIEPTQ